MIRKKISKILAMLMITTSVLGAVNPIVNAEVLTVSTSEESTSLQSGIYTVKNNTKYVEEGNSTGESMARRVLNEDSKVKIENGKVYLTMYFNESMYGFLGAIKVSLNGVELSVDSNVEEKSITVEVPSVDSKVQIDAEVLVMGRNVGFYVENDLATLSLVEAFEEESITGVTLEEGKYKVTNVTRYITDSEHGNSSARGAINDQTEINVQEGKTYLTITFSNMYSMLEDITASIDGQPLELTHNESAKTITFEVPYADSEVLLGMNIKGMNHQVEFYVSNDMTTLEKVAVEEEKPSEEDKNETLPEVTPEVKPEEGNKDENESSSENTASKIYTIENEVYHESSIGMTMARQYLNSSSKVEEINGQFFVTLTFTGVEYMNNHEIYVNDTKVSTETVESAEGTIALKFAINTLSDSIKVSTYVIPMGRSIEFDVKLLEDTLTLVNGTIEESKEENTIGTGSTSTTTGANTVIDTKVEEESNVKETVTVKVYNVQNNVTHSNATGQAMARKYLNSLTEVKEINGKYYVTLTFTGVEFMNNHEIYVNGSKVSHTVISNNGDSLSLRFVVGSLEDSISVKTYVVPMGREVEFGVELLLDTLTLVDEYTIEADELPQTGAAASSAVALSVGMMAIASGTVIRRKRK